MGFAQHSLGAPRMLGRTLEGRYTLPPFQAGPFDLSGISPKIYYYPKLKLYGSNLFFKKIYRLPQIKLAFLFSRTDRESRQRLTFS